MKMLKMMVAAFVIALSTHNAYAVRMGAGVAVVEPEVAINTMKRLLDGLKTGGMPNGAPVWQDESGAPTQEWVDAMIRVCNQVRVENPQITKSALMTSIRNAVVDAMMNRRDKGGTVNSGNINRQINRISQGF
jgi:hypothetical protein